jgi:outer membrane immunogenic protein
VAVLALGALAGPARAADLPVKTPAVAVAPPSWTGCYLGVHAGYGWARNRTIDDDFDRGLLASTNTATGALAGGQAGCDY